MNTIYERFVACMAAFLNGTSAEADTAVWTMDEWKALYRLARRQSLSGALCVVLGTLPMPEEAQKRLQRDAFQMMTRYEAQQQIIADMTAALTKAKVVHLFFKGAVIREYYPQPSMRSMGDVDLVIRTEDTATAKAAMEAIGFVCEEETGEVLTFVRDGYPVEMHTLVRRYDVHCQSSVFYDDVWCDAVPTGGEAYRWNDEQEAAHTVMHMAGHFCAGGCGLRQWMDIAVLCKRFPQESFWNEVARRLEPFGMRRFLEHTLFLCKTWFGVAVPTALSRPLDGMLAQSLLERVLGGGTFGLDERLVMADARKELRREKKSGKIKRVWRRVFPEAAYIRSHYTYAARHGVLLPFAYGHRLVQGLTKHRRIHLKRWKYAHERQDALQKEAEFFEQIGL